MDTPPHILQITLPQGGHGHTSSNNVRTCIVVTERRPRRSQIFTSPVFAPEISCQTTLFERQVTLLLLRGHGLPTGEWSRDRVRVVTSQARNVPAGHVTHLMGTTGEEGLDADNKGTMLVERYRRLLHVIVSMSRDLKSVT